MSFIDTSRQAAPGAPNKRLRSPNVETIIRAAAKEGQRVARVVTKPGGITEITFAGDDSDEREAAAS